MDRELERKIIDFNLREEKFNKLHKKELMPSRRELMSSRNSDRDEQYSLYREN